MNSKTYWSNREDIQREKTIINQAKYDKELKSIYDEMMSNAQKEIDAFYTKYAIDEGITMAEAKKRVSALDMEIYAKKAEKYVASKDLSTQANEEMKIYNLTMKVNRLEMLKANIGMHLVDGFDDMQKYFETKLTDQTLNEFERQAGILGKAVQNPSKMANSIVNASFKNATYSNRIWMYQDILKNELNKQLQIGLIQGKNPKVLAQDIRKRFGVSLYESERLMRTEMARVQIDAQMKSFERNGYDEYQFHALGAKACEICRPLDGEHFKIKDMLPGENAPPMHPNCRCSTSAYMDEEEFEKWINGKERGE